MSRTENRHPSEDQLLRCLDGELPSGEAGKVRTHLEACWQCRTEMERLEKVIAQCVDYRRNVLEEHLPAPPRPWADLYPRFAAADAEGEGGRWLAGKGCGGTLRSIGNTAAALRFAGESLGARLFHMPRWVPVTVALALSVGIYQRFSLAPTAQAAVLLRKAVSAAESRRQSPRRIQIRTRTQRLVRSLPVPVQAVADAETSALARRFTAAHYDWNDPLSARAFEQWRDQLEAKRDEVADRDGRLRIQTSTASSDLSEATLALRSDDLRPVEGTFRFRDNEVVEITELPAQSVPARETAVAPSAVLETPTAQQPAPPPPTPETTAALELRVVAALQSVGADLGEAIEIRRFPDRIDVRGTGIDPDRRQKIQEALAALPQVAVQFTDAAPAGRVVEPTQAISGSPDTALQSTLEQRAGGRDRLERISSEALDRTDSLMARAYALRRMAERFPQSAEAQLSDAGRASMTGLLREHAAVLLTHATDLERQLTGLLGAPASPATPALPSDWQAATDQLFRTASRTERLLAAMVGGAQTGVAAGALPGELAASLHQLKGTAEAYRQMLDNRRK